MCARTCTQENKGERIHKPTVHRIRIQISSGYSSGSRQRRAMRPDFRMHSRYTKLIIDMYECISHCKRERLRARTCALEKERAV